MKMEWTEEHVKEIMKGLFKPRSICICQNPYPRLPSEPAENSELSEKEATLYFFYRCSNCNQWISEQRVWEEDLKIKKVFKVSKQ